MQVTIKLDDRRILNKVTNDTFGIFVSNEWKRLIDQYTPRKTGTLMRNVKKLPFKLHYKEPYAHYMYTGKVYVDPEYKVGGFYSSTYGWFSRPNVKKIPSNRTFTYNKNLNKNATDHWDIVAARNGQLSKLYRTINKQLQR